MTRPTLTEFLLARLAEDDLVPNWARAVSLEIQVGTVGEPEQQDIATVYASHPDYREEWSA